MRKRLPWAVSVVCALAAGEAASQTAHFKCPKPNTVVQFADGTVATWQSAGSNYCQVHTKQPNGSEQISYWFAPTFGIRDTSAGSYANQVKPWTFWPLVVGKKFTGQFSGAGNTPGYQGTWDDTAVVERFEKVVMKAGTFDAFMVTKKEQALSHNYKSTSTAWYAPEPGVIVKYAFTDNQGTNRSSEAIAITQ